METMTPMKPGQATWTSNPTPANTPEAELTEMIREERYERTLKNIARRAETLWEDGYTFMPGVVDNGIHFVFTPKNDCYIVSVAADLPRCTCPAFGKYGTCKHFLAVHRLISDRDAALAAELDARELAESATTGTDPYARY